MKFKNTLFLLIVTLALGGGYYYLAKVKKLESTDELEAKRKRFFEIKSGDVSQVEIKGVDREIQFEKKGDQWMMKKPLEVRADSSVIGGILSKVEYLEHKRILSPRDIAEAKLTLADYGLDKPKTTVNFKLKDQADIEIKVGNERRQGNDQYIQMGGDPNIYVVDRDLGEQLGKKMDDFREKSLFELTSDQVQHFEIQSGTKHLEFSKSNDVWKIVQPMTARADAGKVGEFLSQTIGLRAEDFLSEDPGAAKQYDLDEPYHSTVKLDSANSSVFLILGSNLKNDDQRMAAKIKGQNSIVSIGVGFTNQVIMTLNDFRDRNLTSFDSSKVSEIEIHHRKATTTLIREGEKGWKFKDAQPFDADQELVNGFLSRLGGVQIKEFVTDVATDLDKYSLKNPISGIVLKGEAVGASTNSAPAGALLNLQLGSGESKKKITYVKLAEESSVYGIDEKDSSDFPASALDFRSRLLMEIKKDHIKTCVQKRGKASVEMKRGEDGVWKLGDETLGVLDETSLQKFLNHFEHFTCEKIIGTAVNSTLKQYGLDNPALILTLHVEDGGKSEDHEIRIGKTTAAKENYILWKNQLLVCKISSPDYETLTNSWVVKTPPASTK